MRLWRLTEALELNMLTEKYGKLIQLDKVQKLHDHLKYESPVRYLLAPRLVISSK